MFGLRGRLGLLGGQLGERPRGRLLARPACRLMATLSALPVPSQERSATLEPHEGIAPDEGMGCREFYTLTRDLGFEGTAALDLFKKKKNC